MANSGGFAQKKRFSHGSWKAIKDHNSQHENGCMKTCNTVDW
jgi:hypothetical protein